MSVLGKTKKDVILEFRTTEILAAARTVFARKGYASATVDEIAEGAGVAKGTVYLYFPSKRDVFLASLREGVLELVSEARAEVHRATTVAGKIRAFIHARLSYCERNWDFFRIYYTEFADMQVRSSSARPEFQDLYDQQTQMLESLLTEGIRNGEVRCLDVPKTARLVFELTRAAIAQHALGWAHEPIDQTTDLLCDLIWRGIGCSADSAPRS